MDQSDCGLKSKKKDQTGVASIRYNDQVYIDDQDKANILNQYFSSVFTVEDASQTPVDTEDEVSEMQSISINPAGVAPFKATGPDDIPAYLLKKIANQLAPSLTLVFKTSLNQSKLPSDWKIAHIIPAHKNGDRSLPNNYRPISLTSLCCKALEHIISTSIYSHLSQANVLCDAQHGFRERRSCESQLAITMDDFMTCLNNKGLIHAIFLDFKKAFDKVLHKKLCDKLVTYDICGKTLEWIIDFYLTELKVCWLEAKVCWLEAKLAIL